MNKSTYDLIKRFAYENNLHCAIKNDEGSGYVLTELTTWPLSSIPFIKVITDVSLHNPPGMLVEVYDSSGWFNSPVSYGDPEVYRMVNHFYDSNDSIHGLHPESELSEKSLADSFKKFLTYYANELRSRANSVVKSTSSRRKDPKNMK